MKSSSVELFWQQPAGGSLKSTAIFVKACGCQTLSQSALGSCGSPANQQLWSLVCSTSLLVPCIGLYTASVVWLIDVVIGWCESDCDALTQLLCIQINMENTSPLPTWRVSLVWQTKGISFSGYCCTVGILKVEYLMICIICDTDLVNKLILQVYTLHKYK